MEVGAQPGPQGFSLKKWVLPTGQWKFLSKPGYNILNEEKFPAISGESFQNCLKKNQRKDGSALSIIAFSVLIACLFVCLQAVVFNMAAVVQKKGNAIQW